MPTQEEYEKKASHYFNEEGLLTALPSKRPVKQIILARFADYFDYDRTYTEKEVNEILLSHMAFTDMELIRRELYEARFLNRTINGSAYWREKPKEEA